LDFVTDNAVEEVIPTPRRLRDKSVVCYW